MMSRFHRAFAARLLAAILLPMASAATAQSFAQRDFVRNGGFELTNTDPAGYASGWHSSSFNARVESGADPQGGRALRLDADAAGAFVHQELHLPDQIQSATLSLRVRVVNRYSDLPPLAGSLINGVIGIVPYTTGEQIDLNNALLGGTLLAPDASGPTAWMDLTIPLDAEAVGILNTARSQNRRVALYFAPTANNERQSLLLDNVAFRINGSYTPIAQAGQIAYVEGNRLRRIAPGGGSAQTVWTHPGASPDLRQPRWRPNAEEIAFLSDHEMAYSHFLSDVYAMRPDGGGLRRISNAPSQMAIETGSFPRGTVRLTITNNYSHVSGDTISSLFVLVRGGDLVPVNLPPVGQSVQVTISNVARFIQAPQPIVFFYASNRCGLNRRDYGGEVAVLPGSTVDHSLGFNAVNCTGLQSTALELAWKRDGTALGYTVSSAPFLLPTAGSTGPGAVWFDTGSLVGALSWSPLDDRLLHTMSFAGSHLYVREPSSGGAPQQLIQDASLATPDHPVWLPNGSGFLYSSGSEINQADATGNNRQRLTVSARGEYFGRASPSPDGSWLVLERQLLGHGGADEFSLWLMRRDQPASLRPLATGRMPDWSRVEPAQAAQIFASGFE